MRTSSSKRQLGLAFALSATLLLNACQTTQSGGKGGSGAPRATLVPTLQYIPEVAIDPQLGLKRLDSESANPYAEKKRVDARSVDLFIKVKRAMKVGDRKKAERVLQELMDSDKTISGPYVMSGDIARKAGELDQAYVFYEEALRINPKNVNAYLRIALIERERGNYLKAQNWLAKSLAIWPDFPEAHLNLGVLYDLYINHPINGQKHLEAYHYLTNFKNKEVDQWITELQGRTGMQRIFSKPN